MDKKELLFLLLFSLLFLFKPKACLSDGPANLSGTYKGYNVILIILDALPPDHLGCYGYPKKTSPTIDTLAQKGIIFRNAFSQSVITLPSVVTTFTSLYPFSHGIKNIFRETLSDNMLTLAQILKMCEYKTVWFGRLSDPHSGGAPNVLKGFDEREDLWTYDETTKLLSWIDQHNKEKFFITVHSYATHCPTLLFRRFNNDFFQQVSKTTLKKIDDFQEKNWENINKQEILRTWFVNITDKELVKNYQRYFEQPYSEKNLDRIFHSDLKHKARLDMLLTKEKNTFLDSFSDKEISDMLLLLDSSISAIDSTLIKPLITKLKAINRYDKTIIIIMADHANEYKEHGYIGHGRFVYDKSIHIPLIFHLPSFQGVFNMEELVEVVDIFPTVLDLLGIPIPSQAQGVSLLKNIEADRLLLTKKYVLSESASGLISIRSKEWKLIVSCKGDKYEGVVPKELFDLKRDSEEKNNLVNIRIDIVKQLQEYLIKMLSNMVIYQDRKEEFLPEISEETKERIKKTGYW